MDAETIAKKLSPAQRQAIDGAWQSSWGEWFVALGTRHDVRRRLVEMGLLGKRPGSPFLKKGLAVRAILKGE
jgi:hypothetical protein